MNRPLLAFAAVMVAGVTAVGVYLAALGGGEDELVQQVATPTEDATASGGSAASTIAPDPERSPSQSPNPEGFTTYSVPATQRTPAVSIDYPRSWYPYPFTDPVKGYLALNIYTFDPVVWNRSELYPPDSAKVDVSVVASRSDDCGGELGAGEPSTLAGIAAHRVAATYDPPHPSGLVRSVVFWADNNEYCVIILGAFPQSEPDEATFAKMVDSFKIDWQGS